MSYTVFINGRQQSAPAGALLSDVLAAAGFPRHFDCGGNGSCGSCAVLVDGRSVLSCQYRIYSDITISCDIDTEPWDGSSARSAGFGPTDLQTDRLSAQSAVYTSAGQTHINRSGLPDIFLLDIGTTTLALKHIDAKGRVLHSSVALNPQRRFGTDVMSRISYCSAHGVSECRQILIDEIVRMISACPCPEPRDCRRLIAAGNTAMLHILCGEDVTGLGIFPYTPKFLDKREYVIPELVSLGIEKAELLPCISAYVGADAVAGLLAVSGQESDRQSNPAGRWNLLCDLGTNAEILLWSSDKLFAASAAAGPCFEGAGISCGMPALPGAICGFAFGGRRSTAGSAFVDSDHRTGVFENGAGTYVSNARRLITTVSAAEPLGICGTGLFDIVASLLDFGLCSYDGEMSGGDFEVYADKGRKIVFTQKDMRQFQLAKAAVAACIDLLMARAGIGCPDIENLYISGGFSSRLNLCNAAKTGLFPSELTEKAQSIKNSCLDGLCRFAMSDRDPATDLHSAITVDPALEPDFQKIFLSHLSF